MRFFPPYGEWQLDIVGIVAILGEGSITRNAQASGCSWFHVLPRLMPAPQALLKHHQERRLPTVPGVVVGAYSGRIKTELNFFTQILHNRELQDFEVELVEVAKAPGKEHKAPYSVKRYGHLAALSIFGCCLSITLLGLAFWQRDGSAILADILLSFTSTAVGLASKWKLQWIQDEPNQQRRGKIPHGDVVIFYPKTGSFRVVRCDEVVSRMYFNDERCEYYFGDNEYRATALLSTVLLMAGLIFLGNSSDALQVAFAFSYIILNALHWASSALDPTEHIWKRNYVVRRFCTNVPLENREPKMPSGFIAIPDEYGHAPSTTNAFSLAQVKLGKFTEKVIRVLGISEQQVKRVATESVIAREGDQPPAAWTNPPKTQKARSVFGIVLGRAHTGIEAPSAKIEDRYRNMTTALWISIALTGSTKWVRTAHIAPDSEVWDAWLEMAAKRVAPKWSETHTMYIPACREHQSEAGEKCFVLPAFNYQGALKRLFMDYDEKKKHRPLHRMTSPPEAWMTVPVTLMVIVKLKILLRRARIALAQLEPQPPGQKINIVRFAGDKTSAAGSTATASDSSTS